MDEIYVTIADDVLVVEITEVVTLGADNQSGPAALVYMVSAAELASGPVTIGNGRDGTRVVECSVSISEAFDGGVTFTIGTTGSPSCLVAADDSCPGYRNEYIVDLNTVSSADQMYRLFANFGAVPTVGNARITICFENDV